METPTVWEALKEKVTELDRQIATLNDERTDALTLFTVTHCPVKQFDIVKVDVGGSVVRAQVLNARPVLSRKAWVVTLVIINRNNNPHASYSRPVTKDLAWDGIGYVWLSGLIKPLEIEKM